MSQEQPMPNPAVAGRPRRQISIAKLKTTPGLSLIGLPELIGLAGAVLIAILTIFAYFYFYLPSQSRLTTLQLERDQLQGFLRTSQSHLQQNTTVRQQVDRITGSMDDFERNWLANPSTGRMSLYTTVNDLIKSNGLRNTAGPTYTPLEPIGSKAQVQPNTSAEKQTNAKWQTIYPGIAVSVTVEGPYQRVRRFIREIESSRQFLIVNEVELESVTQSGVASEPLTAGGATGGRATLVSLRLEMATYFHRPEVVGAQ
ncbi:MAG TPA: GspMb/PilO family protein [Pyrinomonadaceae bacterium]|nr:GspMb/PilO family protein [Pyrinomonadaceae bacterium]